MFHKDDAIARLKAAAASGGPASVIAGEPGSGDFVVTSVLDLFETGESIAYDVTFRWNGESTRAEWTEDISEGGLLIMTSKAKVTKGAAMLVRFALPIDGRVVTEQAIVKWTRGNAIGVALAAPAAETARQIERYVELMGEERPVPAEEEEEEES